MIIAQRASVSVIIPCFGEPLTLSRALISVAHQTMMPLEVIVVDDGNTPANRNWIEQIVGSLESNLDIRVLHLTKNQGAGMARNQGWNIARGEYIAFLDCDDAWHPKKIEIQYKFMKAYPNIFLSGHLHKQDHHISEWINYKMCNSFNMLSWKKFIFFNQFITPSVMMINSEEFRFRNNQRHMEDFELWLKILLANKSVARLNAELACIFKDPFGISGLSANMLKMEWGELCAYKNAFKSRPFLYPFLLFLYPFSIIKFIRRLFIKYLRNT